MTRDGRHDTDARQTDRHHRRVPSYVTPLTIRHPLAISWRYLREDNVGVGTICSKPSAPRTHLRAAHTSPGQVEVIKTVRPASLLLDRGPT